jgi:phosphate transport system substrate-binding protein
VIRLALERRWTASAVILAVVAMVMTAGCLGGFGGKPRLTQTGSSTVLPLAIAWAEEFNGADIYVSGGGSSHGLNALLNGEADLGDASRLMKGSDYEKVGGDENKVLEDGTATAAAPTGVWPHKWVVAYDVLAVIVNNGNDWARELSYDQLYEIFTDDDPADYWDQVTGLDGAPHQKIEIYAPDEASGTYDFFFEELIPDWGKDGQKADTRLNGGDGFYHPSSDDNVILSAVKENRYAIGYFGFAYYKEYRDKVTAVMVAEYGVGGDGGAHYEEASLENVADYPMARPLHIYTDGVPGPNGSERQKSVNEYLRFILGRGQELVQEIGYVQLDLVDPDLVADQLAKL